MNIIYNNILTSISNNEKLLAILIDPEKINVNDISGIITKVNATQITHVLVGGSTVKENDTETVIKIIKDNTNLPIVIFPGDVSQISSHADALLFLSLISGRNPEYLIEKQVQSVSKLRTTKLEIISTGYILIESGNETAVQRVSQTLPMPKSNCQAIVDTAKAGEYLGMKAIYLEAGSGAKHPIDSSIISQVKKELQIPLIVGGGIKNIQQLNTAYNSGADMVVIGTAIEENTDFLNQLKR